jgi:hypothetical protein
MKNLLSLLFLTLAIILVGLGCKQDDLKNCTADVAADCGGDSTKVQIRIQNTSTHDLCNVVINPCCGEVKLGVIDKNSETCYRSFDSGWDRQYVHFFIANHEFLNQPADYIGATQLLQGEKYTIQINVTSLSNELMTVQITQD